MPHDMKGRSIEFGDWVKARPYNYAERRSPTVGGQIGKAYPVVGRVVQMREGQSCSGDFIWQSLDGMRRDAFGADEAEIVLKADGSEPSAPAGS
jgi:hypothetical protein